MTTDDAILTVAGLCVLAAAVLYASAWRPKKRGPTIAQICTPDPLDAVWNAKDPVISEINAEIERRKRKHQKWTPLLADKRERVNELLRGAR